MKLTIDQWFILMMILKGDGDGGVLADMQFTLFLRNKFD